MSCCSRKPDTVAADNNPDRSTDTAISLQQEKEEEAVSVKELVTLEGVVRPKTILDVATHKIIGRDGRLYLLKSSKNDLAAFSRRRVKILGQIQDSFRKNPIVEVEKIEAL